MLVYEYFGRDECLSPKKIETVRHITSPILMFEILVWRSETLGKENEGLRHYNLFNELEK